MIRNAPTFAAHALRCGQRCEPIHPAFLQNTAIRQHIYCVDFRRHRFHSAAQKKRPFASSAPASRTMSDPVARLLFFDNIHHI
jgi:hypothetical protein